MATAAKSNLSCHALCPFAPSALNLNRNPNLALALQAAAKIKITIRIKRKNLADSLTHYATSQIASEFGQRPATGTVAAETDCPTARGAFSCDIGSGILL